MVIRTIQMFVIVCVVAIYHQSAGALEWDGCLSDEAYHQFLEAYKVDPAAVSKHPDIFKKTSSKQYYNIFTALGTTNFTYLYPVAIKGEEMPDLTGKEIKSLSLMAVKGGRLAPIPFQIDEFDITGLIYIKDVSPYEPEGTPGILDKTDELVFMFRDAGTVPYEATPKACMAGRILKEIRLDSPRNGMRYVYIVEGNNERSNADYADIDLNAGVVQTTMYKIGFDRKNFADLLEISPQVGPKHGQNDLDNLYVKLTTGIISEHIRFELNSHDNIHAIPLGVKDGPIRSTLLIKGRIWYYGMPTPFSDYVNINFYEQAINVPSRFTLDTINSVRYFLKFIKRPTVEVAMDFHNLKGAKYIVQNAYDPDHPEKMGVVDNKISPVERKIVASRLPGEWIYLDSNQGWTMFFSNQMNIQPGGLFDEYMDGMTVHMLYEDSLQSKRKYERYPGAEPLIGVTTEGMPYQAINMLAALKNLDFSEIDTIGQLISALDRIGEKGDLKPMDKIANQTIARMKKRGRIKSKEELIEIILTDVKIFKVKGIERETLFSLLRRALESELNEEMDNFDNWKLIHKMIELAKEDGVDFNEFQYAVTDSTLWFPARMDNNDPEDFNRQTKNLPKVSIVPYDRRKTGRN